MSSNPYFRRILLVAIIGVGILALTTCSISKEADGGPVQLVYQDWRTDWFPPMAQELLDEFHAEHPNIRVFYTPDPDNVETAMLEAMEAGTAPDVFQGCCSFFPIWAQEGHTLDLAPLIERDIDDAVISEWSPAQYEALRTDSGQQFGVPKYHGALAIYYNKDLFDEYGVAYPDETWDHDDYLNAMRQLTHDTDNDGDTDIWGSMIDVSWERIQMHVNDWGGHFVDPSNPRNCVMDEPPALEALEWLRSAMWDEQVMARLSDVGATETRHAFIGGEIAMVEDGSWALKDILANADFRIGVAPFPAGPAARVTLGTTDGFGIYAGTRYPEEAWELVKFLISREYGIAMAEANFLQPARTSLVNDWVEIIEQQFPAQTRELDLAAFADGHLKGYSVTAEIFADQATASAAASDAWDQILTLGTQPTDSIQSVCSLIEGASRN